MYVCVCYLSCFRGLYALHNLPTRKILPEGDITSRLYQR